MNDFETICNARGIRLHLLWESEALEDKRVDRIGIYLMDSALAAVAFYADGRGFDVFERRHDLSFDSTDAPLNALDEMRHITMNN